MTSTIANEIENIAAMQADEKLAELRKKIYPYLAKYKYTYNFSWLGRPIIQLTEDMILMQEIIFNVKPDLIIETGIAHGGSLVFSASILQLLGGDRKVLGIDIDIREHNRVAIENHPVSKHISMLEGSSIDGSIAEQVYNFAKTQNV